MKSEALVNFPYIELTCLGLMLFLAAFLLVVFQTYHPSQKKRFQTIENLPFEDEK